VKRLFRKVSEKDEEQLLVKELIQGVVLGFLLGFLTAFLLLGW
jgi:F0F1-type ATP synthase assembly protein I